MKIDKFVESINDDIVDLVSRVRTVDALWLCDELIEHAKSSEKITLITDDVLHISDVPNYAFMLNYLEIIVWSQETKKLYTFGDIVNIVYTFMFNTSEGQSVINLANVASVDWQESFMDTLVNAVESKRKELSTEVS